MDRNRAFDHFGRPKPERRFSPQPGPAGPARPPGAASHLCLFEGPARGLAGAVRISSAPEALWGWSYKSVIQIAGPKRRARAVVTERMRAPARRQRALVLISGIRFELR